MVEFSGLLSGSDNLFKYLFTIGVFLIVVSVFYPLQKEEEPKLETNSYNKEVAILNNDIRLLNSEIDHLKNRSNELLGELDSMSKVKNHTPSFKKKIVLQYKIEELSLAFQKAKDTANIHLASAQKASIRMEYDKSKAVILSDFANKYKTIFKWLIIVGIIISLFGLAFWSRAAILTEKIRKKEFLKT